MVSSIARPLVLVASAVLLLAPTLCLAFTSTGGGAQLLLSKRGTYLHHVSATTTTTSLFTTSITTSSTSDSASINDASSSTTTARKSNGEISDHYDAVVCGGGPAGLLTAIMLAQRFPTQQIHVIEKSPTPPLPLADEEWNTDDALARFYTLGVFGRGVRALKAFGVWNDVRAVSQELIGNQVWRSNTTFLKTDTKPTLFQDQGREPIYALPRDKLVSALYEHIQTNYPNQIQFQFGSTVDPVSFDHPFNNNQSSSTCVLLDIHNNNTNTKTTITTDFLIGSDGAARTVANRMEQVDKANHQKMNPFRRLVAGRPFRIKRFKDTNPRVYKTIPVRLPKDWERNIGYSASNMNDMERKYSIVSLPSDTKGGLCAILLMKQGDPMAQANTTGVDLRRVLDENLPVFSKLVTDDKVLESVAQKPPSTFPLWRYAGPKLHQGSHTLILGDACHSVKPYNGLGVNSAFEDVRILSDIILKKQAQQQKEEESNSQQSPKATVKEMENFYQSVVTSFSKTRAKDCKAVVTLSKAGDRPGRLGRLSFLIPLIMDAMFHKTFPWLFEIPIPGLVHNDKYRFRQVAIRKRWERFAQVSIIGLSVALMIQLLKLITRQTISMVRAIA